MAGKREREHRALLRLAHKDGTYEMLFEMQGGRCAICGASAPEDRRFDIDHDHRTMAIRGLLCRGCNMRLRKDHKPEWLEHAANYLRYPIDVTEILGGMHEGQEQG